MINIPFRKICYVSSDMVKAIKDGDEEMIEYYSLILDRQLSFMDVYLITDCMFTPLTPEQEKFIKLSRETALCTEII